MRGYQTSPRWIGSLWRHLSHSLSCQPSRIFWNAQDRLMKSMVQMVLPWTQGFLLADRPQKGLIIRNNCIRSTRWSIPCPQFFLSRRLLMAEPLIHIRCLMVRHYPEVMHVNKSCRGWTRPMMSTSASLNRSKEPEELCPRWSYEERRANRGVECHTLWIHFTSKEQVAKMIWSLFWIEFAQSGRTQSNDIVCRFVNREALLT